MNTIVLDGTDPAVFARATQLLEQFNAGPRLLSQNFGVAIAVLLHRDVPGAPPAGPARRIKPARSGAPVRSSALQHEICDPTWAKAPAFQPAGSEGPIYKPFTTHFKAPSSVRNNWRNSLNLQGGIGCDAPTGQLASASFLAAPRLACPHRDAAGICRSPAGHGTRGLCFEPSKGRSSAGSGPSALDRPKLLARGLDGRRTAHWFVEPTLATLTGLLARADKRVPVYPFAAALYGGSPYLHQWGADVAQERLQRDLVLSPQAFGTLFDVDPGSPFNAAMLDGVSTGATPAAVDPPQQEPRWREALSRPVRYRERGDGELRARARREADPVRRARMLERANAGHRRTLRDLVDQLAADGYALDEQLDGYDLHARRGTGSSHLFEVKTWTPANLGRQVRSGFAQLLEYRYRNRARLADEVRLHLVLEREPPQQHWAWDFLVGELDVTPSWIEDGRLATLPQHVRRLPG